MSDTALALLITVVLLLALAAWVPLLHAVQTLTLRSARPVSRKVAPGRRHDEGDLDDSREAA